MRPDLGHIPMGEVLLWPSAWAKVAQKALYYYGVFEDMLEV